MIRIIILIISRDKDPKCLISRSLSPSSPCSPPRPPSRRTTRSSTSTRRATTRPTRRSTQLHQADRHPDQPHRGRRGRADRAHPQRRRAQPRRRADHRRRGPPVARRAARPVPAGEVRGAGSAHPGELARSGRPVVRLLAARARDRVQQGEGEAGAKSPTYEILADPKWKGKICMRSCDARLQPVADGRDDRPPGRGRRPRSGRRRCAAISRATPRAATPTS